MDASRHKLLQVARARLKLTEEDYRAILETYGGSRSARGLDNRGFDAVMDRFRQLGFTSDARARAYGERAGMATPAQVAAVLKLWNTWADDPTEKALNTFLEGVAKVSSLRFLDSAGAHRAISALKAMVAKRRKKAVGA